VDRGAIWLAAYPDIYSHGYDYVGAVKHLAAQAGVTSRLDWPAIRKAIQVRNGILVEVAIGTPAGATPRPAVKQTPPPAKPTPAPTPTPIEEDDDLKDIPAEWLQERSPDPWFDQP
ncbi:MAG: hypothetical protein ACK46X_20260, partial [Candidatus Sericytochromatia bacterium]